jgi:hypothetical protein
MFFSFILLNQCECKNSMSNAVQETFEKLLSTLNLWISTVIYNILLGIIQSSPQDLQFFYYNSLELRILTVNKAIAK